MDQDDFPHRFRVAAPWLLAQQLLVMFVGFGLAEAAGVAAGVFPPPRRAMLLGLAVATTMMTVTTAGMTVVLSRRLTLRVGPAGLRFARLVGGPTVVRWADVEAVRSRQVGLIPHLLLTGRGHGRPVVVPLRLDDPHGFADAVSEFAGPDHPLTVALRDRLPAD